MSILFLKTLFLTFTNLLLKKMYLCSQFLTISYIQLFFAFTSTSPNLAFASLETFFSAELTDLIFAPNFTTAKDISQFYIFLNQNPHYFGLFVNCSVPQSL
ncbi:hypothetical protein BpHYR1_027192 [Brachionus plicatilis]|uniref:Uncharacterized protein n=1 Tax=Brachionus plicatilis TaxID=10195 RepID=A0A3M7PG52_BRAPC|nr:hypothetical protein BpHYR1_027192 [Brachionus plicatilis]